VLLAKTLRSSTLRLALIWIGIFGTAVAALLGYVYWSSASYMLRQSDQALATELVTLREAYSRDCEIGLKRWNVQIKRAGLGFELKLPSSRFRRAIGAWANVPTDLEGNTISREEFERRLPGWIPSASDKGFVKSLMQRIVEPGKMAAWIAPPERGINNLPVDYEYVRLN